MSEWSRSQAKIVISLCNRLTENTTIAKKAAMARSCELDADLIFASLIKAEADLALSGRHGGFGVYRAR